MKAIYISTIRSKVLFPPKNDKTFRVPALDDDDDDVNENNDNKINNDNNAYIQTYIHTYIHTYTRPLLKDEQGNYY